MKSVSSKNKLWIIITLCILVVGMTLFGVLGFNNTVDGKSSYEVKVSIDANIGEASSKMQTATESYFSEVGVTDKAYTRQLLNDGCIAIYKFDNNVTDKVSVEDLKTAITTAVADSGLIVETDIYEVLPLQESQNLLVILGGGIAIVAILVYLLFTQKIASALSTLFVMVLSALLYVAVMGITRLPANNTALLFGLATAVFGGVLSTGISNRCLEELKNEGNSKLSYKQIADKATNLSTLRFILFLVSSLVISVLLIALGTGYVRLYGLNLIVSAIVSAYSAYTFTAFIWSAVNNSKKDKKSKTKVNQIETEEQA